MQDKLMDIFSHSSLIYFHKPRKIYDALFISTISIGTVSSNLTTQIHSANRTERDRENKAVTKTIVA